MMTVVIIGEMVMVIMIGNDNSGDDNGGDDDW